MSCILSSVKGKIDAFKNKGRQGNYNFSQQYLGEQDSVYEHSLGVPRLKKKTSSVCHIVKVLFYKSKYVLMTGLRHRGPKIFKTKQSFRTATKRKKRQN
jgi:hypothetical protein